ncbi:hypothetical protein L0222_21465 [bacterium]|nr:hypothetical protein [bacterium]
MRIFYTTGEELNDPPQFLGNFKTLDAAAVEAYPFLKDSSVVRLYVRYYGFGEADWPKDMDWQLRYLLVKLLAKPKLDSGTKSSLTEMTKSD